MVHRPFQRGGVVNRDLPGVEGGVRASPGLRGSCKPSSAQFAQCPPPHNFEGSSLGLQSQPSPVLLSRSLVNLLLVRGDSLLPLKVSSVL